MFPTEVLKIRAFRNLWLGQAVSQFGDAFYYVVFMFMVEKITGSAKMVGFTGAFETLPYLLFSAYAGVLADRVDRKRIMLLSDLLCAAILIAFAVLVATNAKPPIWSIFATAFLGSAVRAFFLPAKNAAIPSLVPEDLLMKANAMSSITQSLMPVVGLALSASVLGALYSISRTWFFLTAVLVNAASFVVSALYILKLPTMVAIQEEERHPWTDFVMGLRYIKQHSVVATLLGLAVLMNLMISPFFVAYVIANKEWFGGTPQTLTFCELTFFVGIILGSGIVGKLKVRKPGMGYIIAVAGIGAGVCAMGFSRPLWLFCFWNFLCGVVVPFADIPFTTYFQLTIEDQFRGRVNSANNMLRAGVMPIGLSMGGLLVKEVGLMGSFLVMGGGMFVVAILGLLSRGFREAVIPDVVAVEEREALPQAEVVGAA